MTYQTMPHTSSHRCPLCQREFTSAKGLAIHKTKVHGKTKDAPSPKDEKKIQKGSRVNHTATPTDTNKIKCKICGKYYKKKGIKIHEKVHEKKAKKEENESEKPC